MSDRPIIFSAPMVRALLAGRKTQTRRLLNPQPETFMVDGAECTVEAVHVQGDALPRVATGLCLTTQKVPYAKGDRLYVREAWAPVSACTHNDPGTQALCDNGFYRADGATVDGEIDRWRPSIHMPRWASRLTLAVEDVRIERLQNISEDDAVAEGIERYGYGSLWGWIDYGETNPNMTRCFADPRASYHSLWNTLHGAEAWAANPWVVAVSFSVVRGNIDQIGRAA